MDSLSAAYQYLQMANDSGVTIMPATWKNKMIREVAISTGAFFVEPLPIFHQRSPRGIADYSLFMDAHHPNINGYIILANEFCKALKKIYGIEDSKTEFTYEEIINDFRITREDLILYDLKSVAWHVDLSTETSEPAERIATAERFLEKVKSTDPRSSEVVVYEAIIAVLKNDLQQFQAALSADSVWTNPQFFSLSLLDIRNEAFHIIHDKLKVWEHANLVSDWEVKKFSSIVRQR